MSTLLRDASPSTFYGIVLEGCISLYWKKMHPSNTNYYPTLTLSFPSSTSTSVGTEIAGHCVAFGGIVSHIHSTRTFTSPWHFPTSRIKLKSGADALVTVLYATITAVNSSAGAARPSPL